MSTTVLKKSLFDRRRSLLWWSVGMAVLGGLYTALYPALKDVLSSVEDYPEDVLKALGLEGGADLATPEGYLQLELFSIMAPIALIAYASALCVGAIAGSERKGDMELLLANPISRAAVFSQRFGAMPISTLVLGVVLWVSLAIGIPLGVWSDLSNWNLVQMMLSLILLGWAFGSIGLCVSAITGNSGISYAVVGALGFGMFVISSFAQIIDGMEALKWASLFHYYSGSDPLTAGLNWWHTLAPLTVIAVTYGIGLIAFDRRDLNQPG